MAGKTRTLRKEIIVWHTRREKPRLNVNQRTLGSYMVVAKKWPDYIDQPFVSVLFRVPCMHLMAGMYFPTPPGSLVPWVSFDGIGFPHDDISAWAYMPEGPSKAR